MLKLSYFPSVVDGILLIFGESMAPEKRSLSPSVCLGGLDSMIHLMSKVAFHRERVLLFACAKQMFGPWHHLTSMAPRSEP